ncbi:MAG TPA: hypothetical protein PLO61_11025 [Fimbriimonadaceae bacterium]|nr:hypothetical protein [Fimbriimonadaceae bacterium]HRJ34118.1 hypothetical protein [Fimbriimonadaceae bacterium]
MSKVVESGIEFDFSQALEVKKHDRPVNEDGEGNLIWNGVDFRVRLPQEWLWIEVKHWDAAQIPAQHLEGQRDSFIEKMSSESFGLEMRSKFFGTSAFLAWSGGFQASKVVFVLVFEPPKPLDKALLGTFWQQRIRSAFPSKNHPWTHQISSVVMDVEAWNLAYPELPAKIV